MFSASPLGYEMRDITCLILPYREKRPARADDIIRIFGISRGESRDNLTCDLFKIKILLNYRGQAVRCHCADAFLARG